VGGVRKVRQDKVVSRGDTHILLVGDPGAGKCTNGNAKIILENGEITTMESFYEKNISFNNSQESTMKIFSINENGLNFTSQPLKFWRRKSPKKMIKIVTQTGNELIVTREHPIFTTRNGLIFSKKADEFKLGDYIATPSKIDILGSLQITPSDIEKTKANNKKKYVCKPIIDSDFARYLGYLIGDGYVRFSDTSGVIRFTNSDQDLLNDFENLTKKIFGCKVSNKTNKNNCWDYRWFSVDIVRILQKIFPNITKKSEGMGIPKLICKSPNYVIKDFLKSIFDCEGHIRKGRREIEFSSKSKELIYDIKYILLRFGIVSQVSSSMKCATNTLAKIKRRYYRIRISGEDVIKYFKEIGFVSTKKNEQLNKEIQKNLKINTNLNVVPELKELLSILRKKYGLSQNSFEITRSTYQHYEKGDRFPSYNKLKLICKRYNEIGKAKSDPLIDILNQTANSDIFWDKIRSIETIESNGDYVYDLEIDKVHNFVADGVVIHNSALLKRINRVAPKGIYISGKGISAAGLTASVVKDEFLKGWSLEAGAMVLSSNGICCIDEMDKMSPEDTSAMHEALENQTVSISKANIQATLVSRTTVLAAANPKFGRFDPYGIIAEQIELPPALINRFDLIFTIKDLPDEKKDKALSAHMLNLHQNPDTKEPDIPTDFIKKYVAYIRQNVSPQLTDEAIQEIQEYYMKMRAGGSGEGIKTIQISPRQLEALVRLSEAAAKIRLADKVTKKDSRKAIELLEYSMMQVGFDKETGKIDIDRIASGISASQRSNILVVKDVIKEVESRVGKTIPIEDVIEESKVKGVNEEKTEEIIEKLKRQGDIFEPKRGFISQIP
jgi:replicative DNA helicase Mcm